mmetsp:Transcript_5983/g.11704  ORF Transcript_5983/g.11704 Transcript_5983/m.11704 type:complete len:771 (+) Transcript_5983:122-2434(+)
MEAETTEIDIPLIDPALLANLTASERTEALAAAAAARRAEQRAAQRAKEREQDAEQRAISEALEQKKRERERERELEIERMAKAASLKMGGASNAIEGERELGLLRNRGNGGIVATGGNSGLVFMSKKRRAENISTSNGKSMQMQTVSSLKMNANSRELKSESSNGYSRESHLSASQLASIKKAYLGEKAASSLPLNSSGSDLRSSQPDQSNDPISVRQRLRAERQKRRTKKTTFKFEWDAEEDTFEDDDPLYSISATKNNGLRRNGRYNATPASRVAIASRPFYGGGFRKMKMGSNDEVASVLSVTHKPLDKMTARDWRIFRENFDIVVKGGKSPPPLRSFQETPIGVPPIHPKLLDAILNNLKYKEPSPIQRQAIPIGMQRRDLIGIAETGSGKTAAFGIPLCHHVLSFPQSILDTVADEGPLALVMAPTRELALQINIEFGKLLSAQRSVVSLAVVGGQSITEQATKLRSGVHVVVGTPGRINDCVEMAYLVLNQCSYIVLDEADRMIDLGFAPQIEQILDAMGGKLKSENETEAYQQEREDLESLGKVVPRHRLTAMFSATMPSEVERIAKRYLRHPVVVTIGDQDSGKNARIVQKVLFLSSPSQKESTLRDLLRRTRPDEKIIVFVNEKKHADGVGRMVENAGRRCVVLHGGKTQEQREENLALFRRGGVVLVATDVAGRGLDIPDVSQVINFDLPTRSIENYCHRIGRTGRAGKEGLATSFITDDDEGIMAPLKAYLESTGMPVPDRLARHPAAVVGLHGGNIR